MNLKKKFKRKKINQNNKKKCNNINKMISLLEFKFMINNGFMYMV